MSIFDSLGRLFEESEQVMAEILGTICSYNGYTPAIKELLKRMENTTKKSDYSATFTRGVWEEITDYDCVSYTGGQLEMIWMFLVLMYGEYGVSPRAGWIEDENIPACKVFLKVMIEQDGDEDEDEHEDEVIITHETFQKMLASAIAKGMSHTDPVGEPGEPGVPE